MWDQDGGAQSGPSRDRSVPTPQDPWEAVAPDLWPSSPHGIDPHGIDPHSLDPHSIDPQHGIGPDPHGFGRRPGVEPTRAEEPRSGGGYASGRASVPKPAPAALHRPTTELPPVRPARRAEPPVPVSWHRPSRQRLRILSDGWGLSATGLLLAFIGWGIWAAVRKEEPGQSLLWFGIICGVAVGVFIICRLIGRVLIEQMLGRPRRHARWAHAATGLFLAVCGAYYVGDTQWDWIKDGIDWVKGWWA